MKRLRIGIDARMDKPWATGLGRYARAMVRALTALDAPDIQWVVLKHPLMADVGFAAPGSGAEEALVPADLDSVANLLAAPAIHRLRLDLYHALENFVPPGLRVPRIVITTHDLVWVEHAELVVHTRFGRLQSLLVRQFGTATMYHALRRAHAVVAVSEATRRDVLRRFPFVRPDLVTVVHHGVDREAFRPGVDHEPTVPPFFLGLGNSRPYKNLGGALRALALLGEPDVQLVLAGRGDCFESLERLAARLGILSSVRFVRMPGDAEVLRLFHGAQALLFPSLIEGFGLPVIEAMSAGCPVIVSAIPVLREVCGDAALYVDATRPEDIARAMRAVLSSAQERESLRQRGFERVRAFDWSRAAARVFGIYRKLLDL